MTNDLLNEMIIYIEDHLTEKIDYKKLSKIVGTNEFILQRVFMFITGISLSSYIRKRRLSKAYEELKLTDNKIIDIALKYGYDSSISFARAFKNEFNKTPRECRKDKTKSFKGFPIMIFKEEKSYYDNLDYEIKIKDQIKIYTKCVKAKTEEDLYYKIRRLYDNLRKNGLYNYINEIGQYAVTKNTDDGYFTYYVGCKAKFSSATEIIIPKGKYAVFKVNSRKQKDIINAWEFIYEKWLLSVSYKVLDGYEFEEYIDDTCYLYLPIK